MAELQLNTLRVSAKQNQAQDSAGDRQQNAIPDQQF